MTDDWDQSEQNADTWDSFLSYPTPVMQHTTSWHKYSDAVEERCDLTKVEAKRCGPAIAAPFIG